MRTPISRAFKHLRASPSLNFARWRARVGVHLHVVIAEAALGIGQGAIDQLFELLDLERFELENLGARDERAVDVEEWIVGGGADEAQVSALDVGQEDVLLRFVEVMDLVDEQDRFLAGGGEAILRRGHDFAHLGDVAFDAAQAFEFRLGHFGDDLREGGFAGAGRAGEDDGREAVGFDGAAEEFAGREDVLLADEFLERARPHAGGEGRGGGGRLDGFGFCVAAEQVFHGGR